MAYSTYGKGGSDIALTMILIVEFVIAVILSPILAVILVPKQMKKFMRLFILGSFIALLSNIGIIALIGISHSISFLKTNPYYYSRYEAEDSLKYSIDISPDDHTSYDDLKPNKIVELHLRGSYLNEFPEELMVCKKVNNIRFAFNGINIDQTICKLAQFSNLESLSISGCSLEFLPEEIEKLHSLKFLNIGLNPNLNNEIDLDKISKLNNLEEIWIMKNNLTSIPKSFIKLTKLKKMRLDLNKIETIPEFLNDLPNLKEITLNKNPIKEVQVDTLKIKVNTNDRTKY
jgi:Leucine-rich repeat (LRR) protein